MSDEARGELSVRTGGDARQALNALEVAALLVRGNDQREITLGEVGEALQRRVVRYDRAGDNHYDVISAFIKSVRGSDPDAALYWLFLMLEGGEDPEFIARRLLVLASEDIGLADSGALRIVVAAADALAYVGLPEAAYHLAHATVYLAVAPKSNSIAHAIAAAKTLVQEGPAPNVPAHLRSTGYQGAHEVGHGMGYEYSHDFPGAVTAQQFFPDGVEPEILYRPGDRGEEAVVRKRLDQIDKMAKRPERA
jgi:putative ATPase